ncbi:MAG: hypothetical protein HC778_06905, partial [Chamaesiphon sp. CSU_1_12]|nr:hypothetical protein [Chamaesiphon sp. CSU_1_12]
QGERLSERHDRGEAERAARRLERRGYNAYVQLSREVNRRSVNLTEFTYSDVSYSSGCRSFL